MSQRIIYSGYTRKHGKSPKKMFIPKIGELGDTGPCKHHPKWRIKPPKSTNNKPFSSGQTPPSQRIRDNIAANREEDHDAEKPKPPTSQPVIEPSPALGYFIKLPDDMINYYASARHSPQTIDFAKARLRDYLGCRGLSRGNGETHCVVFSGRITANQSLSTVVGRNP